MWTVIICRNGAPFRGWKKKLHNMNAKQCSVVSVSRQSCVYACHCYCLLSLSSDHENLKPILSGILQYCLQDRRKNTIVWANAEHVKIRPSYISERADTRMSTCRRRGSWNDSFQKQTNYSRRYLTAVNCLCFIFHADSVMKLCSLFTQLCSLHTAAVVRRTRISSESVRSRSIRS